MANARTARPRPAKKAPAAKGKGKGAGSAGRAKKPEKAAKNAKSAAVKPRTKRVARAEGGKPKSLRRPPLKAIAPVILGRPPSTPPGSEHLDWDDSPRAAGHAAFQGASTDLVRRWVSRGEELLQALAARSVGGHEVRADLKEGRFVWIAPDGRVSAEAKTQVVCSWSRSTSVVAMAWIDPLIRASGIARIDGMPSEQDDVDEEGAWRIAMEGAEACGAEYLYRVPTPHAWYFLALRDLSFSPAQESFSPGTPVDAVLRGLIETRTAIASRAEPSEVVRERLAGVGSALLHQAEYAYRGTDWVARLTRSGRHLLHLARRLARPTYNSVAAGVRVNEWVERSVAVELLAAIDLLEDEWSAFA
jgi:hypothetical protein